jgi:hypothetical protein
MMRRRDFGVASASAAALAAFPSLAAARQHDDHTGHGGAFADCAKACSDCQRECDGCAVHCATLLAQGKKDHLATMRTCADCADVCSVAAQITSRQGPFSAAICKACADVCAGCGKECEKFPDDKMMAACAKECRACEKACREMLKHTA